MTKRTEVTARELLLVALAGALLSVVMHWPLILNLGDTIPKDLGDPLPQSWQIAWGGHALTEQPFDFFQSNMFWPEPDSLAFGDALIGYAPAGLIGEGPHAAVARYDLLFLFAYALCFFGAYWLGRELGLRPLGAAIAGVAYAYAPFRLEQDGHMQVISSGGIPLTLGLGVRALRLKRPGLLIAAALVAAWQVSLGFAIGLPFAYLLALLAAVAAALWWRRGRPAPPRRLIVAGLAGVAIFVGTVGLISLPYFRVADAYPEATREPSDVEEFSGGLEVFILNSDENWVWGEATIDIFDEVNNPAEKALFPGLLILILAAVGLGSSSFPRWLRSSLGGSVVALWILQLGFQEEQGWLWPYRIIYDVLPGWEAIRTPGRLATFSTLALALLAAAGAEATVRGARRHLAERRPGPAGTRRWAAPVVAGLLVFGIVVEGRGLPFDPWDDQDQPAVDEVPPSVADLPAPQLHLPAEGGEENRRYVLWSTDGFPLLVNGRASTRPDSIEELITDMRDFPSEATVERLRAYGVRSVVLHTDLTQDWPQAGAELRPVEGLPVSVSRRGPLVIYELR
ncbi:MAG TPA: hypothetical protein VE523_00415 [Solirubrobacterales bacterium]|nr:hypothetical protein [Solirubrobacterales bacterium]